MSDLKPIDAGTGFNDAGPVVLGTPTASTYAYMPRKNPHCTDLMVDLETLDTLSTSSILSIGAVFFNRDAGLLDTYYTVVNTSSCDDYNLTKSASTMAWWERQSEEAKAVLREAASEDAPELYDVLTEFRQFIQTRANLNQVKVWGNGSDFDNSILQNAFSAVGIITPWKFWNNRCLRTLKDFDKSPEPKGAFEGVKHNALDDAISQAKTAIRIQQQLLN